MYRIDNATAVPVLPAVPAVGPNPNGFFFKGDPAAATPATIVDDAWLNTLQEELCAVVIAGGLALNKANRTQIRDALLAMFPRLTKLTGNTTLYVSTAGNDGTGDGSAGNPFRTAQKAWNYAQANYHLSGFQLTILRADGAYTDGVSAFGRMVGQGSPVLFAGSNSANVTVNSPGSSCYTSDGGAFIDVEGQKIICAGNGLYATRGGAMSFGGINFGTCGAAHIVADRGGQIVQLTPITISGDASTHANVGSGGSVDIGAGGANTIVGARNFAASFVGSSFGFINSLGATWAGAAVTGTRYSANLNGVINSNGGGAAYFPGNAAGTTATGGQYA